VREVEAHQEIATPSLQVTTRLNHQSIFRKGEGEKGQF
jgi:hypothetical protein